MNRNQYITKEQVSIARMLNRGYFRLAKNVSKESTYRIRLGAVLVNKKPISVGFNKNKTHPTFTVSEKVGGIHAEISAIINAGRYDLKGTSIYVYREYSGGFPANSRPCIFCRAELKSRGVKWMYYTVSTLPYWKRERV